MWNVTALCKVCRKERYSEYRSAYQKQYYREHKEQCLAYGKEHYAENREAYRMAADRWVAEHPEEASRHKRQYAHRRRAIINGSQFAKIHPDDVLRRFSVFGNACVYCGATGCKLTADHVIPLSRGGPHILANIRPACGPCNSSKHAKKPSEWAGRPT